MQRRHIISDEHRLPKPRRVRVPLEDAPGRPVAITVTLIPTPGDLLCLDEVAGCRFYQPALARLACARPRDGFPCILIPEPHNPHDGKGIAVWTRGGRCGYIPRSLNPEIIGRIAPLEQRHGTPIAVRGSLCATDYGLALMIELPPAILREH